MSKITEAAIAATRELASNHPEWTAPIVAAFAAPVVRDRAGVTMAEARRATHAAVKRPTAPRVTETATPAAHTAPAAPTKPLHEASSEERGALLEQSTGADHPSPFWNRPAADQQASDQQVETPAAAHRAATELAKLPNEKFYDEAAAGIDRMFSGGNSPFAKSTRRR